jgi:hypothetical protein
MSYWLAMILTFGASFVFIFLKAFQQRNVAFDRYAWVLPVSFAMALVEVYVIANIAQKGFSLAIVLVIGLGSGLGALAAMLAHKRIFRP